MTLKFFLGVAEVAHATVWPQVMISANRLRRRVSDFEAGDWMMDSGAFTEVARHGGYRTDVRDYAALIRRFASSGNLVAAAAQDFMCEQFVLAITGKTVEQHQRLTVDRYEELMACELAGVPILPVIQGYEPDEYVRHIDMYGDLLPHGAWVGVGSVCKRNASPRSVERVLFSIRYHRPDLKLHGFGLKLTALQSPEVWRSLHSADSMAWSFAARKQGRNANDPQEGARWAARIKEPVQPAQQALEWAA